MKGPGKDYNNLHFLSLSINKSQDKTIQCQNLKKCEVQNNSILNLSPLIHVLKFVNSLFLSSAVCVKVFHAIAPL